MKISRRRWINFTISIILSITLVSLVASCSKKKTDDGGMNIGAYVSFVNAIPKASSVDFFVDIIKTNNLAMPFSKGLDYFSINEGLKKLDVTFGTTLSVATDQVQMDAGKYYTVFAIGKSPYEIYTTIDDRAAPPPSIKTKIRFINLSPDAPNIDFGIMGGATLFANQAYKSASDFITIDPTNLNLVIRQAGSSTVKASKIDAFFDSGGIYTVVAIGSWTNPSDPQMEIQIIKNK